MSGLWVVCDDNLITFWTRNGPPCSLAGREGRSLVLWEAPVVMVGSDSAEVELRLGAVSWCAHAGVCFPGGVTRGRGRCVGSACCVRGGPGAWRAG